MKVTVVYDDVTSDSFDVLSGVKQGCTLAPTLFKIFFATLLKHAFGKSTEGIYLQTRLDGISLKSLESEPKPECMRNTSLTSYLQTMRPNN